jgi:hypothetical protein
MMVYWSIAGVRGMDFLAYFGLRASFRVFGRRNVVLVLTFLTFFDWVPFNAAFFAA